MSELKLRVTYRNDNSKIATFIEKIRYTFTKRLSDKYLQKCGWKIDNGKWRNFYDRTTSII